MKRLEARRAPLEPIPAALDSSGINREWERLRIWCDGNIDRRPGGGINDLVLCMSWGAIVEPGEWVLWDDADGFAVVPHRQLMQGL